MGSSQEVNINATTLPKNTTDSEWQKYFAGLKMIVQPVREQRMGGVRSIKLQDGEQYKGDTNAIRYKNFINDILSNIRHGGTDFCYYIYQIADLLKYEHSLRAKYRPEYECFEVSLMM